MTQTDRLAGFDAGAAIKCPVVAATTANITLSGTQTIDGIAVVQDDRVLVKDQTDTTENGIYIADSSTWSRATDFDGTRDVVTGTLVVVIGGTVNGDRCFRVTTSGDPDPDDAMAFTAFSVGATGATGGTGATGATGAAGPAGTLPIAVAGGTANALTASFSSAVSLATGALVVVQTIAGTTSTAPTLATDGSTAVPITARGAAVLAPFDIPSSGFPAMFEYQSSGPRWELLNPQAYLRSTGGTVSGAITLNGALTMGGIVTLSTAALNTAQSSALVASSAIDLDAATGNVIEISGTSTDVRLITLTSGRTRLVRFSGSPAPVLVHSSSQLALPSSANIATAAGDYALFVGSTSPLVRVAQYQRLTGQALVTASGANDIIVIQYQVASGVAASGYASAGWRTVSINTEVTDSAAIATLSTANVLSLAAGSYEFHGVANVGAAPTNAGARLRLRNTTDGTTVMQGVQIATTSTTDVYDLRLSVDGSLTISSSKSFELQVYPSGTLNGARALTTGDLEVYTHLRLRRYST